MLYSCTVQNAPVLSTTILIPPFLTPTGAGFSHAGWEKFDDVWRVCVLSEYFLCQGWGCSLQHGDRSSYLWNTIFFGSTSVFIKSFFFKSGFLCKQKGTLYTGFGTGPHRLGLVSGVLWLRKGGHFRNPHVLLRTYLRVKPITGWICGSTMMGHTVTRKKSR